MILIDGNKYSCLECIRGHRSSLCRHHMRALLQVRSKGRPNFQFSPGNKNHRIAVFAEKVADSGDNETKDCKNVPVVILKTSDKHVIDISNGQIVGPYKGNAISFQASKPLVMADNFVNSSSCCSKGASRVRKSCQCNKGKVSKSKILKSYIDKKIKQQGLGEVTRCGKKEELSPVVAPSGGQLCCAKKKPAFLQLEPPTKLKIEGGADVAGNGYPNPLQSLATVQKDQMFHNIDDSQLGVNHKKPSTPPISNHPAPNLYVSNSTNDVFQVINVPNCSLPGTCSCSSDCACPNCMTHHNTNTEPKNIHGLEFLTSDLQFESNLILTLNPHLRNDQNNQQYPDHTIATYPNVHALSLSFPTALGQNGYSPSMAPPADLHPYLNQAQNGSQFLSLPNRQDGHVELQYMPLPNEEMIGNPQFPPQYPSALPREYDFYNNILKQVIGSTILTVESPSQPSEEDVSSACACPEDSCGCNNCETHGIIDGYKLDDIFMSKIPLADFQRNEGYRN